MAHPEATAIVVGLLGVVVLLFGHGVRSKIFGVLLIVGLASRAVALAAFGFLTSLWVSEWGTAWIWELLVPMVVAACLALGTPGRRLGVDAALARRHPDVLLW